jgi:signal transduction histidine kinase
VKSVDSVVGITVDDSGPGVPEPLRASIFDRFWKGEPSAKRLSGGTGLGLAIVREFVELHRGSVDVSTSDLGGARFTVQIPASAPLGASVTSAPDIPIDSSEFVLRSDAGGDNHVPTAPNGIVGEGDGLVLVVEDHPDMRKYLVDSLAKGHRVATAANGREGLKLVDQLHPDLVVSDLMMPDVDGESLVRELRAKPEDADVGILIVSARSDSEIRERLLRAGAQDFVVKPFSIVELRARVDNQIQAKLTKDVLRRELTTHQNDLLALARELSERSRALRLAVAARDDFLSSAAHELKTPLAVLVLQAQLIARKAASDPSAPVDHDRIDSILVAVGKLNTLVVELLDITRADNGRLVGKREGVDLSGLICQVSEERQSSKHRFVVDVDGPLHASVDRVRIKQLLVNLMDNAAKYSPAGGEVAVTGRRSDRVIHLEVADHGIGIPAGDLPYVFDRLRRASNVDDRRFVGMGLGLFISRAIVEQHGGRIWATSDGPGLGTTIHVDLPEDESLDSSAEAPSTAA